MAEIYLSDGRIWNIREHPGEGYEVTVYTQHAEKREENRNVKQNYSADIKPPYLGEIGSRGIAPALKPGTAISRDHIKADWGTGGWFSSGEKNILREIGPEDFRKAFGEKYRTRRYEDIQISFPGTDQGVFALEKRNQKSLYNNSDLVVVSPGGDPDRSDTEIREARREVLEDLRLLAERALEPEISMEEEEN